MNEEKKHLCKKEDGTLVDYASPDQIILTSACDGEVYHLQYYDFDTEEFEESRPIGWCPWCGENLEELIK